MAHQRVPLKDVLKEFLTLNIQGTSYRTNDVTSLAVKIVPEKKKMKIFRFY